MEVFDQLLPTPMAGKIAINFGGHRHETMNAYVQKQPESSQLPIQMNFA